MELRELKSQKDIKKFKQLMNLLHPQGHPQGAVYAKGWRFWALKKRGIPRTNNTITATSQRSTL